MNKLKERAAELLESASFVLSAEGWWTTGFFARDEEQRCDDPQLPTACSFCIIGAVVAARHGLGFPYSAECRALATVVNLIPDGNIALFNDYQVQTANEAAELLWLAAQDLRGTL